MDRSVSLLWVATSHVRRLLTISDCKSSRFLSWASPSRACAYVSRVTRLSPVSGVPQAGQLLGALACTPSTALYRLWNEVSPALEASLVLTSSSRFCSFSTAWYATKRKEQQTPKRPGVGLSSCSLR